MLAEEIFVTRKEHTLRGQIESEHIVQLFDTTESLIDVLSRFVTEALRQDAKVLLVARPRNWDAVAAHLVKQGIDVGEAVDHGRITILHVAATKATFMQ